MKKLLLAPLLLLLALGFDPKVAQSGGRTPVRRGNYIVCPNGKTIPDRFWVFPPAVDEYSLITRMYNGKWDTPLEYRRKADRVISMTSAVVIGKKTAKDYDKDLIYKFKKKLLSGGRNTIPASYKSFSIKEKRHPNSSPNSNQIWGWEYKFRNSEGKEMTILRSYGRYEQLTNHQGKTFEANTSRPIGSMSCSLDGETIDLRIVQEIRLKSITNEYGELQALPLMFWYIESRVKAESPKSENMINF